MSAGLNWREIDAVLAELELAGSFIRDVRQPVHQQLIFELYAPRRRRFWLLVSFAPRHTRLHRLAARPAALGDPQRFVAFMRAHARGGRINEALQVGQERIVKLAVARGGGAPVLIWLRLWGNAANCIVTRPDGHVLDALFRRPRRGEISGGNYHPERDLEQLRPQAEQLRPEPEPLRTEPEPPAPSPSRSAPSPSRPASSLSRSAPSLSRPAPSLSRPTSSLSRPASSLSRPASSPSRPASSLSRPTLSPSNSASSPSRPAPSLSRSAPSLSRPAPSPSRPASSPSRPTRGASSPLPSASASSRRASVPVRKAAAGGAPPRVNCHCGRSGTPPTPTTCGWSGTLRRWRRRSVPLRQSGVPPAPGPGRNSGCNGWCSGWNASYPPPPTTNGCASWATCCWPT